MLERGAFLKDPKLGKLYEVSYVTSKSKGSKRVTVWLLDCSLPCDDIYVVPEPFTVGEIEARGLVRVVPAPDSELVPV